MRLDIHITNKFKVKYNEFAQGGLLVKAHSQREGLESITDIFEGEIELQEFFNDYGRWWN